LALTSGKIRGVKLDAAQLAGNAPAESSAIVSTLEGTLIAGGVSQQTHESIVAQVESGKNGGQPRHNGRNETQESPTALPDVSTVAGLLLGSPEFQRR